MPLTNPGTSFDEDGWADALADIRKLFLLVEGSNDMGGTTEVSQVSDDFKDIDVSVCVNGVDKTMTVKGTEPQ